MTTAFALLAERSFLPETTNGIAASAKNNVTFIRNSNYTAFQRS